MAVFLRSGRGCSWHPLVVLLASVAAGLQYESALLQSQAYDRFHDPAEQFADSSEALPMTDLEAEVARTSRVAGILAKDSAALSQELQGLQAVIARGRLAMAGAAQESLMRMPGEARLRLLELGGASSLLPEGREALMLQEEDTTAAPAAKVATSAAPATSSAAPTTAAAAAAQTESGSDDACGGEGQVECGTFMKVFTLGYRFSPAVSVVQWVVILIASSFACWCCCMCFGRRRS